MTANVDVPNVVLMTFSGKAAPSFADARRVGFRVKDDLSEEDRDAFFDLPPMDAKTRKAFVSACGA